MLKAKLLGATAGAEAALAIEDVFSTYLYTGNGSTQTITNGIDLAGEGGMVWLKGRSTAAQYHVVYDTERGATKAVYTNDTLAEGTRSSGLTAFNSNGFSVGNFGYENLSGDNFASWTFRKAPRFFDVVTYTGNDVAGRTIAHDLGVEPGCIIVKATSAADNWQVYHRSNTAAPATDYLMLNSTAFTADSNTRWNDTLPTSTVFSLGTDSSVNTTGRTYVAYLFAHDPLGPSGDGSDGLIACGGFTTNGSGAATVNLGWEPQWVLYKESGGVGSWFIYDTMRGFSVGLSNDSVLNANLSNAEIAGANGGQPDPTGFSVSSFPSGSTYIYIAIRRGPMREPTVGTEVYFPSTASGVISTNFPVDFHMRALRSSANVTNHNVRDRLRGGAGQLVTSTLNAETSASDLLFDSNNGLRFSFPSGEIQHFFRRAPGFFDVVAYTGDGVVGRTVPHNLGVVPELMIVKRRSLSGNWAVYNAVSGPTKAIFLNTSAAEGAQTLWNNTIPTESVFTLHDSVTVNAASSTYIAYLFSTLPGVSKVGSYTGNGSSQTINCGFTTGARFILIKRLSATGDWHLFDSARGIVSGNDPYHRPNTDFAEVTTNDSVDPDNSGFIVNQNVNTDINVSSSTYIYLAIA